MTVVMKFLNVLYSTHNIFIKGIYKCSNTFTSLYTSNTQMFILIVSCSYTTRTNTISEKRGKKEIERNRRKIFEYFLIGLSKSQRKYRSLLFGRVHCIVYIVCYVNMLYHYATGMKSRYMPLGGTPTSYTNATLAPTRKMQQSFLRGVSILFLQQKKLDTSDTATARSPKSYRSRTKSQRSCRFIYPNYSVNTLQSQVFFMLFA